MTTIEPIKATTKTTAAATLAAAFANDPVFRWMAHDRDDLDRHLRHGFGAMIAGELRNDDPVLQMTSDGGCASIWHAPETPIAKDAASHRN